jgi:hypothetical protein
MKDPAKWRCFNCREKGHYAHMCPKLLSHHNWMPATNPSPNRGVKSVPMTARQNLTRGNVDQVAVEEAQDTPMNGTILANLNSILTIP